MKRTFFLSALLAVLVHPAQAEDIILNGGDVNYADKILVIDTKDAKVKGAALNSETTVSITGAAKVNFSGNLTQNSYGSAHTVTDADLATGGAVNGGTVIICGNSGNISFTDNELRAKTTNDARSRVRGGAIKGDTVSICNNRGSCITFSGNMAADEYKAWDSTVGAQTDQPRFSYGGAVYADTSLTISGNSGVAVTFSNNEAGKGGAISGGYESVVTLSDNGMVSFTDNLAEYGGAAYNGAYMYNGGNVCGKSELSITGNSGVLFSGNRARGNGGALYNQSNSTLSISNNKGDVSFTGNSAMLYGGAIRGQSSSTISLNDNNGAVTFSGNSVNRTDTTNVYGGAASLDSNGTLSINNNDRVELRNNSVQTNSSAYGGAVSVYNSTLSINGNKKGVSLIGNKVIAIKTSSWGSGVAAEGGAIYGKTLNIRDNGGKVMVQNNVAEAQNNGTAKGGAIYVQDSLNITGNAEVEFRSNVQQSSNQTILRSVYLDSKSTAGALNLSAAAGGSIIFYDSLYAAPNSSSYSLTANFNEENGATGTITFSGAHAEADLLKIKSSATAEEIAASCTSTVQAGITLHNGTLSVQDKAILQSLGMTVKDGATLRLNNGTLNSDTLTSAGAIQLQGSNTLTADFISLTDDCSFNLKLSSENRDNALITLTTEALNYGRVTVNLEGANALEEGDYLVLNLSGSVAQQGKEWSSAGISLTGMGTGDRFEWRDNGTRLYLTHSIVIPEPSTAVLSLLALAGLAARRRRTSHRNSVNP